MIRKHYGEWLLGAFAAAGLAIGAGGSLLAIRKFLQV